MDLISPKIKQAYFNKSHFMANDEHAEMATQFKLSSGEHAVVVFAELGRAKGRRTVHRAHFIQELLEEGVVPHHRVHFNKRTSEMEEDPITRKPLFHSKMALKISLTLFSARKVSTARLASLSSGLIIRAPLRSTTTNGVSSTPSSL
ncbi:hypothetical protein BDP55DRAFT_633772 [Colletotrichum godetiae]|uniref:Uncharacterized protein n=1 Tax=Colletotrichum godetiae TaxID=1209918 RepID=A0AAJ0EW44_9PEZI|nr:uncharacterized protein BDP55DRAFT_633772 [Colletotrichum godetiae]KAK1673824.1 hypothetical protein BDP55DRAFT_633772 [Colletotrichum godetiae]